MIIVVAKVRFESQADRDRAVVKSAPVQQATRKRAATHTASRQIHVTATLYKSMSYGRIAIHSSHILITLTTLIWLKFLGKASS